MTEIEKKALALVNEIAGHDFVHPRDMGDKCWLLEALCRAIEQHEAFRQEVSDAVAYLTGAVDRMASQPDEKYRQTIANDIRAIFARFIIAKPDPLVEALGELADRNLEARQAADTLRAAIEKRGGKIVWGEG